MLKLKISDRTARVLLWLEIACAVALIAVAVASRFYKLGSESIWLDEAITYTRSTFSLDHLLKDTIRRHHVPPYFVLMHYVLQFGDDEFWLRLPSAVFGALAILAATVLGTILAGIRAGVVTGVLFAISPQLLRYSQEARMYAMFVFFSTTALCGLLWLAKHKEAAASWPFPRAGVAAQDPIMVKRTRRAWVTYALATIGVLYSHNTAALFWASCWAVGGVIWLGLPGKRGAFLLNWLVWNGAVFLAWSPWLGILFKQTKEISNHFWAKFPSMGSITDMLSDLYLFGSHRTLQGMLAVGFALFALWSLRKQPVLAISLVLLSVLMPTMILIISLHRPIWLMRLMLWGSVPFFGLVACGVAGLKHRALIAATLAVFVVAGGSSLMSGYYAKHRKPEWSRALRELAATPGGAPPILMIGPKSNRPIVYYTTRNVDRLPSFDVTGCRAPTLDQALVGRRRVVIFLTDKSKYTKPILAMMKTRGKLRRKTSYGSSLTLLEYKVRDEYVHPEPAQTEPAQTEPAPKE